MPLLRIVCPPGRTDQVVRLLETAAGATEIAVVAATVRPAGDDLILAEVPRGRVDELLALIRDRRPGSPMPAGVRVAVEPSKRLLPPPTPSEDDETVVWAQVVRDVGAAGRRSWVNTLLVTAAAAIAAIGIIEDQLLLIVGAMALSPDYFPIADTCLALSRRAWDTARRAAVTLAITFAAAAGGAWLLTEALMVSDLVGSGFTRAQTLTLFISHPDPLSVVVALVAGAAGALAITLPDSRGLVGVFVSITTIPAAANIGVAAAARDGAELAGAGVQLLVNVASLLVAGTVTLVLRHHGQAPRSASGH
jgi:uncharacterized hydrophobic protein (TIGR00271 family)